MGAVRSSGHWALNVNERLEVSESLLAARQECFAGGEIGGRGPAAVACREDAFIHRIRLAAAAARKTIQVFIVSR